jgi:hypothetical protein
VFEANNKNNIIEKLKNNDFWQNRHENDKPKNEIEEKNNNINELSS